MRMTMRDAKEIEVRKAILRGVNVGRSFRMNGISPCKVAMSRCFGIQNVTSVNQISEMMAMKALRD